MESIVPSEAVELRRLDLEIAKTEAAKAQAEVYTKMI